MNEFNTNLIFFLKKKVCSSSHSDDAICLACVAVNKNIFGFFIMFS